MQKPALASDNENMDWLSALLDGEADDDLEGIGRLARDEALKARWSEYCLIGDALRGLSQPSGRVPERVRVALSDEPTILAPVVKPRHRPALWLAAAATVAAVTWMTMHAEPTAAPPVRMAMQSGPAEVAALDVVPYLAAHQDYAQALTSSPEMHFSQVALALPEAAR